MEKISRFCYSINGGNNIIDFEICTTKGQVPEKFSFSIRNNPGLTKKVLDATKSHQVKEKDFFYCAEAIETLIQNENFEKIERGDDVANLYERFQKDFKEIPKMEICGSEDQFFTAKLLNFEIKHLGSGRTKQAAKVNALKNFFSSIE